MISKIFLKINDQIIIERELIINSIKSAIYDALFNYWNALSNSVLLACLLDPRSKTMHDWPIELQTKTIALLRIEYENFKEREIIEQVEDSPNQQTTVKSFSSKIFGPTQSYLF